MKPQVVAHRGASQEFAEHTLAAYQEAITVGAAALECDVRLTADGHLVCVHDRTLTRVTGTPGVVSEMELADLEQLDFSSWKNNWSVEPDLLHPAGGVLTLRTLLETIKDAGRRVELYVETKHPNRYGGMVERVLAEQLRGFGWARQGSPITVMSFQWTALHRMDRLTPELDKILLMDKRKYWPFYERVVHQTGWWLGPRAKGLREHPKYARRLQATGRPLYAWTVNDEADLETCLALGARSFATDRPAWALQALGLATPTTVSVRGQEVSHQAPARP